MNLKQNASIRLGIATSHCVVEFRRCVEQLREAFEPYHDGRKVYVENENENEKKSENIYNLSLPPWICQPYIRMHPDDHVKLISEKQRAAKDPERIQPVFIDDDGNKISRKLMKKLRRASRRPNAKGVRSKKERVLPLCKNGTECVNPMGVKCVRELCRICCRDKCYQNKIECSGHKFFPNNKKRKVNI